MKNFHYFVSHGLGWATGESVDECMTKLFCTSYYGDLGKWLRNCHKDGKAGIPAYCCRVPLPADAKYSIEWFAPQVEGLTERKNLIVTYRTMKKVNWMRDPEDRIRDLENQLDGFKIDAMGDE